MNKEISSDQQLTLDTKKFLEQSLQSILKSVDYAYPYNNYDSDRGHNALSMVSAKAKILLEFVNSLS